MMGNGMFPRDNKQQCSCNRKTRKTQWRPPAPPTGQLPDADEALDEPAPARRTLNDYGVVPVPEGSCHTAQPTP